MIPIYKPYIEKYKKSAENAINEEWISNYGKNIKLASDKLTQLMNNKYCILMNNGTSATQCLLYSLEYKYPNLQHIYIPNNTFISPINCVLNVYKNTDINIHVMKINNKTLNIETNTDYINSLEKNSAILIVHNLGNIINVPRLKKIRPDIIFIEDNCEGIFGSYNNIPSGSGNISLCSALSFYGNKTITTGEGGAYLTNDTELYNYILKKYSHGMTNDRYIHDVLAHNYRMTNICAGFLYDQLCDITHILNKKKIIFTNYLNLIKNIQNKNKKNKIIYIQTETNTKSSKWMFCIIIKNLNYKLFEKYLNEKNINIRPLFYDLRQHKHLINCDKINFDFEEEDIFSHGCMLPSYPDLTIKQQTYIIDCIIDYL